jgi:hypothetical protein
MTDGGTIRLQRAKRPKPPCVFCGNTVDTELHHVGGRSHVAWFILPLCRAHHTRVTDALRQSGVNMSYTSDPRERFARARSALLIFFWMLEEVTRFEEGNHRE